MGADSGEGLVAGGGDVEGGCAWGGEVEYGGGSCRGGERGNGSEEEIKPVEDSGHGREIGERNGSERSSILVELVGTTKLWTHFRTTDQKRGSADGGGSAGDNRLRDGAGAD